MRAVCCVLSTTYIPLVVAVNCVVCAVHHIHASDGPCHMCMLCAVHHIHPLVVPVRAECCVLSTTYIPLLVLVTCVCCVSGRVVNPHDSSVWISGATPCPAEWRLTGSPGEVKILLICVSSDGASASSSGIDTAVIVAPWRAMAVEVVVTSVFVHRHFLCFSFPRSLICRSNHVRAPHPAPPPPPSPFPVSISLPLNAQRM